jgi:hypothetical protein
MSAYKGAWHGHHDGTGADTTWSPRLSPMRVLQGNPPWAYLRIRHELLRIVSAMGFQQLGRSVGNPPYHPDGPSWLAGLGLRRWYNHLVYPQHNGYHYYMTFTDDLNRYGYIYLIKHKSETFKRFKEF